MAVTVTRGILFAHGWIEYSADLTIPVSHHVAWEEYSGAWNPILGVNNSATISQQPILLLFLEGFGTADAEKAFLFACLVTASLGSFGAIYAYLSDMRQRRRLALASFGSALYVLNGWVTVEVIHLFFLWLYALLPVTWWLLTRGFACGRGAWRYGLAAGIIATATGTVFGFVFHGALLVMMCLVFLVQTRTAESVRRSLVLASAWFLGLVATSLYWILPIEFGFRSSFSHGTPWALFTTRDMFTLSSFTPVIDVARTMYSHVNDALVAASLHGWPLTLAHILTFTMPGLAIVLFWLKGRRRIPDAGLAAAALVALTLANGTNPPTGSLYARLSALPGLRYGAYVLLKGPYKWAMLSTFALVMLSVRAVGLLGRHALGRILAVGALGVGEVILASPLLSGDLNGYMKPIAPPRTVAHDLGILDNYQGTRPGNRAVWLPLDNGEMPMTPSWTRPRQALPLLGGQVPPEALWLSNGPVSSLGATYLEPADGRVFDQLLLDTLANNPSSDVGALLRAAGRKDIVVHKDTGEAVGGLLKELNQAVGLRLVYSSPYISIYQSADDPAQPVTERGVGLVVGGLEQLSLQSGRGSTGPLGTPMAFASDLTRLGGERQILDSVRQVTFGSANNWLDLAGDTWMGAGRVAMSDLVPLTTPISPWDKSSFSDSRWLFSDLVEMPGVKFDPSVSPSFLVTGASRASLRISLPPGGSELWVRMLVGPTAGILEASNGPHLRAAAVDAYAPVSEGWRWEHLGVFDGGRGGRVLTLTVRGGMLNALDSALILKPGALAAHARTLASEYSRTPIQVGDRWSDLPAPTAVIESRSLRDAAVQILSGRVVHVQRGADGLTLSVQSHPRSHYYAFRIDIAPSFDLARAQQLVLSIGGSNVSLRAIGLVDRYGDEVDFDTYLGPYGTLAANLAEPVRTHLMRGQASFDMSSVGSVILASSPVAPSRVTAITLHALVATAANPNVRDVEVPRRDAYYLLVSRAPHMPRTATIRVGGYPITVAGHGTVGVAGPIELGSGALAIDFTQASAELPDSLYLVSAERSSWSSPLGRTVTGIHDSGNESFEVTSSSSGSVALLAEPYDPAWTVRTASTQFRGNWFDNGYILDGPSRRVTAVFSADSLLREGRALSGSCLLALGLIVVLVPRVRRLGSRVSSLQYRVLVAGLVTIDLVGSLSLYLILSGRP